MMSRATTPGADVASIHAAFARLLTLTKFVARTPAVVAELLRTRGPLMSNSSAKETGKRLIERL